MYVGANIDKEFTVEDMQTICQNVPSDRWSMNPNDNIICIIPYEVTVTVYKDIDTLCTVLNCTRDVSCIYTGYGTAFRVGNVLVQIHDIGSEDNSNEIAIAEILINKLLIAN